MIIITIIIINLRSSQIVGQRVNLVLSNSNTYYSRTKLAYSNPGHYAIFVKSFLKLHHKPTQPKFNLSVFALLAQQHDFFISAHFFKSMLNKIKNSGLHTTFLFLLTVFFTVFFKSTSVLKNKLLKEHV